MNYFITAIGTDSGKTIVSSILCRALKAAYWKPIQAGLPSDSVQVKLYVPEVYVYKEAYHLKTAESPHAAAGKENLVIKLDQIIMPTHTGDLVIEGAGGLMVPLNNNDKIIDLIDRFKVNVILVCNLYLGSINHSLLSIEALRNRNIIIHGIVFNGPTNSDSEKIILRHAKAPCILHIEKEEEFNEGTIDLYANKLLSNLKHE